MENPETQKIKSAQNVEKVLAQREARAKANADPMPGPLLDAFALEPVKVAGLQMVPVVAYHLTIAKKIDSPLHRMIEQLGIPVEKRKQPKFTDDDIYELIYLFTRPAKESRAVLAQGREVFREAAFEAVADRLDTAVIQFLGQQVFRQVCEEVAKSFNTFLSYEAKKEKGTVFTQPPAEPQTGSAGGLTSFAASPESSATPQST